MTLCRTVVLEPHQVHVLFRKTIAEYELLDSQNLVCLLWMYGIEMAPQQRFSTVKRRSFKWLYTLNLSLFHMSVPFYIIFFHYYSKRDASILRPFNQINPYSIWNCWGLESCLRFAPNKNLVIKERYCICSMYELHRFICPVLGKVDNNGSRWQRNRRKSIKIGICITCRFPNM